MKCPIVIQTCDKYKPYWGGLFNFMGKQWDPEIEQTIYFCNEEESVELPKGWKQIKTGKETFVQSLRSILSQIEEEHIFYMLEDFWPICPMRKKMFDGLYSVFEKEKMNALQISSYLPYYKLDSASKIDGWPLMKFQKDSEWIFNLQARFWVKESFLKCLVEPKISESEVSSAITVEMSSDEYARKELDLNIYLHHYLWYPISGVAYRGKLTDVGEQMENVVKIDNFVKSLSQQDA
jgi:hypothetical protein